VDDRPTPSSTRDTIPNQYAIPWSVAFQVSWAGLRRRIFRSLITMLGVVLAIALLTYMMVTDDITHRLVSLNLDDLNLRLQKAGVDIFSASRVDRMTILLIVLSLITCLVGIINAMLMAVTERIREIGTLKCLGALDSFIVKSYFIESSLQGFLGTLLGMIIGLVVAILVATLHYGRYPVAHFPWPETLGSLLIAAAIGIVLSIVASIAPAYWAARKEPVEAMRVEE
jgi:ABC-type antimicrobial peptide transport system permease subunit